MFNTYCICNPTYMYCLVNKGQTLVKSNNVFRKKNWHLPAQYILIIIVNYLLAIHYNTFKSLRHYIFYLISLNSFVLFIFSIQRLAFFLFLFKLHSLQNYRNMKTQNYSQKLHSVLSPLVKSLVKTWFEVTQSLHTV